MTEQVEAKMDFRYKMGDTQIEGYQITPATRFQPEQWPTWLVMQRLPDETNALYTAGDGTENLILSLPGGDFVLPPLAWVVKAADGTLSIVEAMDMEAWVKVVPIPEPIVTPPADGLEDGTSQKLLRPVPTLENISGDTTEMRAEMMSTIVMLQSDEHEAALKYLKKCMAARTLWCTCSPGECRGDDPTAASLDKASCRQHSPLVV